MPSQLAELVYFDDSGNPRDGTAVLGWVKCSPDRWRDVLGAWLDHRRLLWRHFQIPVTRELHTTHYVHGRGRLATRMPTRYVVDGVEFHKDFGRAVAQKSLEALSSISGLEVGAAYRRGEPADLAEVRAGCYATLVAQWERRLTERDELAMLFMDGDGSDRRFVDVHRRLPLRQRRVIEDVVHLDSAQSQLVQMADLVAWTAWTAIDRPANNEFAWDWYDTYLARSDPSRTPRAI
ncbi:MAG: DUF3800 domain-containing protein [Dermatophilaceae bacterium]